MRGGSGPIAPPAEIVSRETEHCSAPFAGISPPLVLDPRVIPECASAHIRDPASRPQLSVGQRRSPLGGCRRTRRRTLCSALTHIPAHAGARCDHQWRTSTHTLAKPTLRPVHTPSAPPAERYPRAGAGSGEIGLTSLFLISAAADCARPAGTGRSGWHSARSEWWMPRPPGGVRRAGLAGRWPRSRTGTRKCAARHRRGSR